MTARRAFLEISLPTISSKESSPRARLSLVSLLTSQRATPPIPHPASAQQSAATPIAARRLNAGNRHSSSCPPLPAAALHSRLALDRCSRNSHSPPATPLMLPIYSQLDLLQAQMAAVAAAVANAAAGGGAAAAPSLPAANTFASSPAVASPSAAAPSPASATAAAALPPPSSSTPSAISAPAATPAAAPAAPAAAARPSSPVHSSRLAALERALSANETYQSFLRDRLEEVDRLLEVNGEKRRLVEQIDSRVEATKRARSEAGASAAGGSASAAVSALNAPSTLSRKAVFGAPWFVDAQGNVRTQHRMRMEHHAASSYETVCSLAFRFLFRSALLVSALLLRFLLPIPTPCASTNCAVRCP